MERLCHSPWGVANDKELMSLASEDLGPASSHLEERESGASPIEPSGETAVPANTSTAALWETLRQKYPAKPSQHS